MSSIATDDSNNTMDSSLTTHIVTDWSQLETAWGKLEFSRSDETFFQELVIQKCWWQSMNQPTLKAVVVSEHNQPIGILPFCQTGTHLQLLGDKDVTDYHDLLITAGKEALVWEAASEILLHDHSWQDILLMSLPEHSASFNYLQKLATLHGWRYQQVQQDVCPIIDLPSTWEEYLAIIGKKQRHEVTRKWKRLTEHSSVQFRVVTDLQHEPAALNTFFTLHQRSSPDKAAFWTTEHRRYFELLSTAASQQGWLRLYFLDLNGEPAAAMYCFDYQDSLLVYNSGFDAEKYLGMSVGNVLTSYTIQDAIKLGKKKYDFLRGGEEYKLRYRAIPHPVMDVSLQRVDGA